jgi:hypothetical protein
MKPATFFIFAYLIVFSSFISGEIGKDEFYKAFSGKSEADIDKTMARLEQEKSSSLVQAYLGALYMKKSGFVKGAKAKIKMFKKGAGLLEEEIAKKTDNTEYRFLRLAIQENAPKILKYNKDLNTDKRAIMEGYKTLDPDMKKIIKNYAASSEIIKINDLP